MVRGDCGCKEYFEEEEDEEKESFKPWPNPPITSQPDRYATVYAPGHPITIQRPESAHLPNPDPMTGLPIPAAQVFQQPMQIALAQGQQPMQIPIPGQNPIPFPQPAFQPPMVATGLAGQGQVPLQMPVPPIPHPPQMHPPPPMGQPPPFGPAGHHVPPPILGNPVQPMMMPPAHPHGFGQATLQHAAAINI